MGCASSKDEGGPSQGTADPQDVKVDEKGSTQNVSMTGYHTDVQENKNHAFTEQLVHAAP